MTSPLVVLPMGIFLLMTITTASTQQNKMNMREPRSWFSQSFRPVSVKECLSPG
jgi:hypothetical protein